MDADRAREVLAASGIEYLNGSMAFRASVLPGDAIVTAMLAYAAEREAQAHAAGRAEGLEEAAKVADSEPGILSPFRTTGSLGGMRASQCKTIAAAIRARITTTGGGTALAPASSEGETNPLAHRINHE